MDEVIKERKDGFKAECNFRTKEKLYFRFDIFLTFQGHIRYCI